MEAGASRLLRLAPPAGLHRPHLWWPLNLGPQPLYELRVEAYCLEAGGTPAPGSGAPSGGGAGSEGSSSSGSSSRGSGANSTISAVPTSGAPSDVLSERFGVRSVGSGVDPRLGGHAFFVNGEQVFIRGGNWIAADAMLRCPPGRCRREVRLHAGAPGRGPGLGRGALQAQRDEPRCRAQHACLLSSSAQKRPSF